MKYFVQHHITYICNLNKYKAFLTKTFYS